MLAYTSAEVLEQPVYTHHTCETILMESTIFVSFIRISVLVGVGTYRTC